jgi:hypothetical protein
VFYGKTEEKRHACHKCGEELVFETKIGRRDMCPNCNAYLHSCYNCTHHDKNVHNECLENQGEFIRDRSEGNFCLYFDFRVIAGAAGSEAEQAKKKLEALFGGGAVAEKKPTLGAFAGTPKTETDAKARLDALFKK